MALTLSLCGDVMLGRGIDQIFLRSCDPTLREDYVRDARDYVALAEEANGAIGGPVDPSYVWGDALDVLDEAAPQARLINLETAITTSDRFWPGKAVHYRMHPENVTALCVARIDACALANNHLLDFDREGLAETLDALERAGVRTSGAGRDRDRASAPAKVPLPSGGRLLFFSVGSATSGIPSAWAAGSHWPGVALLPNLSIATARGLAEFVRSSKRPGDLAVCSIHWGGNWGYDVSAEQVAFAHALIEGGVDLVHGHSSHHPRPIEVHRGKLILYGCGDFIDDYEGISGYEAYRDDLRVMYLAALDPGTGGLEALRLVPFQSRRLRLCRASPADSEWVASTVTAASRRFGVRVAARAEGELVLQ